MSLIVGREGYEQTEWSNYIHSLNEICNNQIHCDNYFGNPGKIDSNPFLSESNFINTFKKGKISVNFSVFSADIALYTKEDGGFDATVQVPQVYCTLHDCLNETNVYQTLTGSKLEKRRPDENSDTYEVISSCTREQAPSCSEDTKPKIPPKPRHKSKSMHRSRSADDSAKSGGAVPGIPPRRGTCVTRTNKVKGQTSLLGLFKKHNDTGKTSSELKDVYEDISETSRDNMSSPSRLFSQSSFSAKTDPEDVNAPVLPARNINPRGKNIPHKPAILDVKKDLQKMNVADIGALLKKLRLEKYASVFEKQWIDGAILSELTADILHTDCKMTKLEAVRLMTYVGKGHIPG